jgi:phosphoglycerate dehydrogenase-like enzyme
MRMQVFAALLAAPLLALGSNADPPAAATIAQGTAAESTPSATSSSTVDLIASLGLREAPQPVRARPGWRRPRLILVDQRLEKLLPRLQQAAPGVKLVELPAATPKDIAAADATIGVCTPAVLTAAKRLQWIQWPSAGVERCVAQPLLRERAPLLTNLQRTMGPSIAEHAIAMMLALSRHFEEYFRAQQQAHWSRDDSSAAADLEDVEGKTVLVAGLGGIGTEVARRAHALGMRVIATRASGHEGPDFVSYVGLPDELLKLTREADYVVNCVPLTPETTGIFNKVYFASMKRTAYFVSVGRGRSTVTEDLVAALQNGTIAGAGLDVVDPEPLPPQNPLWRAPHLILTPHVAAYTAVASEATDAVLVENLRRYVAGDPMLSVVDINKGY